MKSLVYTKAGEFTFQQSEIPIPMAGEELVRVEYVGICGSDMHAYLGHDERRPPPLILGHEAAGVISGGQNDGQRVTVNPLITCGSCNACQSGRENHCIAREIISMPPREGAFAEYIAIPSDNLISVPDDISNAKAALCEPIACGWNAAKKCEAYLGDEFLHSEALVIGGGAIGLGAALSLRAKGIEDITLIETNKKRIDFLKEKTDFKIDTPTQLTEKTKFDFAIDGVGYEATRAFACEHLRPGGVIAHIGLGSAAGGLDIRKMTLQEISFLGCYTYSMVDFRETAEAIFTGTLGALDWIEIRKLEAGARAFEDIKAGLTPFPKILLQP